MRILIAEDNRATATLLRTTLARADYDVVVASDGLQAYELIREETFDLLITDWLMPRLDGLTLVQRIRDQMSPPPLIVMLSSLTGNRNQALESGADGFLGKPFEPEHVCQTIAELVEHANFETPVDDDGLSFEASEVDQAHLPPYVSVVVATNTGGPQALRQIFQTIPTSCPASYSVIMHGQPWVFQALVPRLQEETALTVRLFRDGMTPDPGEIVFAPGRTRVSLRNSAGTIRFRTAAKQDITLPPADALFTSAAEAFGEFCVGVVLTGQGQDGVAGARQILGVGGTVLVEDPETAMAGDAPKAVIENRCVTEIHELAAIGPAIMKHAGRLWDELASKKRG